MDLAGNLEPVHFRRYVASVKSTRTSCTSSSRFRAVSGSAASDLEAHFVQHVGDEHADEYLVVHD